MEHSKAQPVFDGIVSAQHELDQIAININEWPAEMVSVKIQDTTDLLAAIRKTVDKPPE